MQTLLYVLHFVVCFILIGVVLLQRGKGQDLGASLGGGSANTIFGSRGAGNFLTKITTASAIVFMGTSLSLSYLGYKSSDVRLFDESDPFVPEGSAAPKAPESGLEEIPVPAPGAGAAADAGPGLVEIPAATTGEPSTAAPTDAGAPTAPSAAAPAEAAPSAATPDADPSAAAPDATASDAPSAPATAPAPAADAGQPVAKP